MIKNKCKRQVQAQIFTPTIIKVKTNIYPRLLSFYPIFGLFTNLDPGNYVFKVKGANSDGIWSQQPASIQLVIQPPWDRHWFITHQRINFITKWKNRSGK